MSFDVLQDKIKATLRALFEEGLDGVGAHVAVQGHAIGVEHGAGRPAHLGGSQPRLAVGGGTIIYQEG